MQTERILKWGVTLMKKTLLRIAVFGLLIAVLLPCIFAGTEIVSSFFPKTMSASIEDAVIDGEYIKNIPIGTTAEELLGQFEGSSYITKFYGYKIAESSRVGTGFKLVMGNGTEYTLLVDGDLNGDTYSTGKDIVRAKKHLVAGNSFYYESVLDFNKDGSFTEADLSGFAEFIIDEEPVLDIADCENADLGDNFYATINLSYTDNVVTANIGSNIVASDKTTSVNQIWHFKRHDDGSYVIKSVGMGTAMEVAYASTDMGTNVSLYKVHEADNQRWYLVEQDDGSYIIRSKLAYDRVLDVFSGSTEDETNIHLYGLNYSAAQAFYIEKVDDIDTSSDAYFDQVGPITQPKFYANLTFGSRALAADNGNVCIKANRQYWCFEPQANGTYKITNSSNGKVLDIAAAKMENGTNVQMYDSNDTNAQRWYIYMKNGKAILRSAVNKKFVIDIHGGEDLENRNVHIYTYNGSAAQCLTFTDYTKTLPEYRVSCPYNTIVYGRYNTLEEAKANAVCYLGHVIYNLKGELVYNTCPTVMAAKILHNAKLISDFAAAHGFVYGHADWNPGYNWQSLDITKPTERDERCSSCDRLVDWALWRSGVTDARGNKKVHGPVVYEQHDWVPTLGYIKITNPAALQPGDLVFTTYDRTKPGIPGHAFICASYNMGGNLYLRYDHGSVYRIQYDTNHITTFYKGKEAPFLERIGTADQPIFYYAYRPLD